MYISYDYKELGELNDLCVNEIYTERDGRMRARSLCITCNSFTFETTTFTTAEMSTILMALAYTLVELNNAAGKENP